MHLVVGIGNVGAKYDQTRHNVGFLAIDLLAQRNGIQVKKKRHNSIVGVGTIGGQQVTLCKPTTYVNQTGVAVNELVTAQPCALSEIMVLCDDMSLPVGTIRMRRSGGTGGHNGLASVSDWLDSDDFPRLRIGIGERGHVDGADYVLSRFKPAEKKAVDQALWDAAEAVERWVSEGIEAAMNRHN